MTERQKAPFAGGPPETFACWQVERRPLFWLMLLSLSLSLGTMGCGDPPDEVTASVPPPIRMVTPSRDQGLMPPEEPTRQIEADAGSLDPGDTPSGDPLPGPGPNPDAGTPDLPPSDQPVGVRYVRIDTQESPSWVAWREVQVLADGRNVATMGTATASSHTDDGPVRYLNDDDLDSTWNSGDFPPAWVIIDLGRSYILDEVRVLVAQNPVGPTVHHLGIAGDDRRFTTVHTWRQETENDTWLAWENQEQVDRPPPNQPPEGLPAGLGRGLRWVRTNPMFISGLTVRMPAPTPEQARTYFEDFGANAVHLWTTGLPNEINGWRNTLEASPRFVSWTEDDGRSLDGHELIGGFGANEPGRIGYQVGDEPLSMAEFRPIEEGLRAIRQVDPDTLLIVNFSFWAEDIDEILDHYATLDADVVSFDNYGMGREHYGRMGIFRTAALEMGRPYWCYLVGYGDNDRAEFPHPTGMRWAAMSHATYGYTGYTWFLYQVHESHDLLTALFEVTDRFDSPRSALFDVAAQLNRELTVLGRALTQLTSTAVRYIPKLGMLAPPLNLLAQPPGTQNWAPGDGGDPYLQAVTTDGPTQDVVLGFFTDDARSHYVMVQNPNHVRGTFPTNNTDDATIRLRLNPAAMGAEFDHVEWLNARSGQIERLPLRPVDGGGVVLVLTIPAGDARLLKYPSENPFAQGP